MKKEKTECRKLHWWLHEGQNPEAGKPVGHLSGWRSAGPQASAILVSDPERGRSPASAGSMDAWFASELE